MAYYHGHVQTLQRDYPPFNYKDEVRVARESRLCPPARARSSPG